MSTKPQELNKTIADLRQIIVGEVTLPTDQIEQITLFLFLKQLSKKHNELVRIGAKDLIFTGEHERHHFDILIKHSGEQLVKECREAIESLHKNKNIDETLRRFYERSYLKIMEPKVLAYFLDYLNNSFDQYVDLGDFYESLLDILGTQKKLGQVRTPRHIIQFIIDVIDPKISETICDPACGTAGFLLLSLFYLKEKYTDKKGKLNLNPEQRRKLFNQTFYGWDKDPLMVKYALANLYFHDLKNPNVYQNDTLLNENLWQHSFDIIVANPPFITPKGGARRHSRFAIASNKTEVLFCEYMVHHLNFNGRMGIIVPEGIIFDQSKGHQAIRKLFLDNGLWCVVSLPQKVFNPYSPVKTSIVFLDKTFKPDQILFYEIENHGFSLNTNPAPINKNDLPNALEVIKKYRVNLQNGKQITFDETKYYTISKQKILENSTTDLSGNKHRNGNTKPIKSLDRVDIDEVAFIQEGPGIRTYEYQDKGFPIINVRGVRDGYIDLISSKGVNPELAKGKWKHFQIHEGDILFTTSGTIGRSAIVKKENLPLLMNTSVVRFRTLDEKKLSNIFLYYLLQSAVFIGDLTSQSTGIAQQNVGPTHIKRIKIPLPPIEIQEQIVAELDGYAGIIAGAKQIAQNWKPKIDINPEWEKCFLKSLVNITTGKLNANVASKDGEYPFFTCSKDVYKIEKYSFDCEALLLAGNNASADYDVKLYKGKFDAYQRTYVITIKKCDQIIYQYLKNILEQKLPELKSKSVGNLTKYLTLGVIQELEIPLPPLKTQKQIVVKIEEEQKIVEANKRLIEIFEEKIKEKIEEVWE